MYHPDTTVHSINLHLERETPQNNPPTYGVRPISPYKFSIPPFPTCENPFNYYFMTEGAIKIAIIDEFTLFRKMLKGYLSEQKNIGIITHTSDPFELLNRLKYFPIDILLCDILISNVNIIDVLKTVQVRYPEIRIIILSTCTDPKVISNLLDLGIHGYISKSDEPEELLQAIMAVADNRIYRNKLFTEALYYNKQYNIKPGINGLHASLNEREKKVLQLLWEEKSNKEIADQLFLSIRSIEKIRQDMKDKLGLKSTVGLLKYGITNRIIESVNSTV